MKCTYKIQAAAALMVVLVISGFGASIFIGSGMIYKRHWDRERCTVDKIINNSWELTKSGITESGVVYNTTIVTVSFLYHNNTYVDEAHALCVYVYDLGKHNCDWKLETTYDCWVYHTYPKIPRALIGVTLFKNPKINPNDNARVTAVFIIIFTIILITPCVIGALVWFIKSIYKLKKPLTL